MEPGVKKNKTDLSNLFKMTWFDRKMYSKSFTKVINVYNKMKSQTWWYRPGSRTEHSSFSSTEQLTNRQDASL